MDLKVSPLCTWSMYILFIFDLVALVILKREGRFRIANGSHDIDEPGNNLITYRASFITLFADDQHEAVRNLSTQFEEDRKFSCSVAIALRSVVITEHVYVEMNRHQDLFNLFRKIMTTASVLESNMIRQQVENERMMGALRVDLQTAYNMLHSMTACSRIISLIIFLCVHLVAEPDAEAKVEAKAEAAMGPGFASTGAITCC